MPTPKLPTKESIVKDALNYEKLEGHLAYSKGYAACVRDLSVYLQDAYRSKIEKLIK